MNERRTGYVIALVVTVVVLVASMAVAAMAMHRSSVARGAVLGGGMMGRSFDGNGWGGMMDRGDSGDSGDSAVTEAQARATAQTWVDAHAPGATLSDPISMRMGYVFTVSRDNQVVARIMVNDDTGQYSVREFAGASTAPSASASG